MTADLRPSITFSVPTRESAQVKAIRLLAMGRVRLHSVRQGRCWATVVGDAGIYAVSCNHSTWRCTCEGRADRCSHVAPVRMVVDLSGTEGHR